MINNEYEQFPIHLETDNLKEPLELERAVDDMLINYLIEKLGN